jgi:hypothetical protein
MARRSEIILFSYRTLCSDEDYLATPSEGVITGKIIVEVLMAPITEYRGSESSEIELQDKYDKSRSTLKGGRCMNKYGDILHHHHHLRRGEITTDKVVFISPITPRSFVRLAQNLFQLDPHLLPKRAPFFRRHHLTGLKNSITHPHPSMYTFISVEGC